MFVHGPSPIALLHAAASECRLPYASLITEIADSSTILCGVELELPQLELIGPCHELFFFWQTAYLDLNDAYEKACLEAVSFLQLFYNLTITNYYCDGQITYREVRNENFPTLTPDYYPSKVNYVCNGSSTLHPKRTHN